MFNPPRWIGLDNWVRVLNKHEFWVSIRNVFVFALIFVPIQTIMAFVIAFMLNQAIRQGLVPAVLFPPRRDSVDRRRRGLGVDVQLSIRRDQLGAGVCRPCPVKWIDSSHWLMVISSIAIVQVWKGVGQSMIMILAGMQNVPKEVLEASQIDGANGWKQLTKVVFPMVTPMVYLVMILSTISAFQAFDVFLGLFGSITTGIPERNMVPNLLVYRDAFLLFKMGPASATAWLLFVIILSFTLFQKYFEKKWVHYD